MILIGTLAHVDYYLCQKTMPISKNPWVCFDIETKKLIVSRTKLDIDDLIVVFCNSYREQEKLLEKPFEKGCNVIKRDLLNILMEIINAKEVFVTYQEGETQYQAQIET